MAWVDLPCTGDPYRNVDETQLDELQAQVQDALVDELGQTVKRPGLSELLDLGTSAAVDGLYWWHEQGMLIAVSAGRVWKITDALGTKTEVTGATLTPSVRVTFATDGTTLLMANGGQMVSYTGGATMAVIADADAPVNVTHVAYLDGYMLANKVNTAFFYFSDINNPLSWNASSFASANATPGNLLALHTGWREILLVKPRGVEIWFNDGLTPFVRLDGGAIERGCSAPYSIQQVNNNWVFLDDRRQFVKLDGRTPTPISFPFYKQIMRYQAVDDAVSDVSYVDGYPLYLTHFANAHKTLVYHMVKESWTEWGNWSYPLADYSRFKGNCYAFARAWGKHFFGDVANGKVYMSDRTIYQDAGSDIRSFRRTGWITHNTQNYKRSKELQIRCKRALGQTAINRAAFQPTVFQESAFQVSDNVPPTPRMVVRWRDNDGAWGNDHDVSLGAVGEHFMTARLFRLGRYRMRQYEFIHSDNSDWIFVGAKEDIDLLSGKEAP